MIKKNKQQKLQIDTFKRLRVTKAQRSTLWLKSMKETHFVCALNRNLWLNS